MSKKLYIGNLSYDTGEIALQGLFEQAGSVAGTVRIMRDFASGRSRGFGYVQMTTEQDAQKAISELNDFWLCGHVLSVSEVN